MCPLSVPLLLPLSLSLSLLTSAAGHGCAFAASAATVAVGAGGLGGTALTLSSQRCSIVLAGTPATLPTTFAGEPATMARGATGFRTKEPAPIMEPLPIVMLPSTVALAPMSTLLPILGCRSPVSLPVPPKVTFCSMEQLSPMTAVSPMTTPVPWSRRMPLPMRAPGWMSTANTSEDLLCSARAMTRLPLLHSECATRWVWMAWKPLQFRMTCTMLMHAGSRSIPASTSASAPQRMSSSRLSTSTKISNSWVGSRVVSARRLDSTNANDFSKLS
mmetsp:Transcript_8588/g.23071  ORF Transcript_8588/g.23071 Transcript_8588/m.23071 type:complete len:274 (+) Transcript_8588:197-1018(+)